MQAYFLTKKKMADVDLRNIMKLPHLFKLLELVSFLTIFMVIINVSNYLPCSNTLKSKPHIIQNILILQGIGLSILMLYRVPECSFLPGKILVSIAILIINEIKLNIFSRKLMNTSLKMS